MSTSSPVLFLMLNVYYTHSMQEFSIVPLLMKEYPSNSVFAESFHEEESFITLAGFSLVEHGVIQNLMKHRNKSKVTRKALENAKPGSKPIPLFTSSSTYSMYAVALSLSDLAHLKNLDGIEKAIAKNEAKIKASIPQELLDIRKNLNANKRKFKK